MVGTRGLPWFALVFAARVHTARHSQTQLPCGRHRFRRLAVSCLYSAKYPLLTLGKAFVECPTNDYSINENYDYSINDFGALAISISRKKRISHRGINVK